MEDTLFSQKVKRPLADRLRPQNLSEVVGQDHVVGPDAPLGRMVKSGQNHLFHSLGAAGLRQNHHRPPDRRTYQFVL